MIPHEQPMTMIPIYMREIVTCSDLREAVYLYTNLKLVAGDELTAYEHHECQTQILRLRLKA